MLVELKAVIVCTEWMEVVTSYFLCRSSSTERSSRVTSASSSSGNEKEILKYARSLSLIQLARDPKHGYENHFKFFGNAAVMSLTHDSESSSERLFEQNRNKFLGLADGVMHSSFECVFHMYRKIGANVDELSQSRGRAVVVLM